MTPPNILTRMQNIFSSIVTQFQQASGAMDAMSDSTGELTQSYDRYLDSIAGRTAQLKATFQEISTKVLNSGSVKSLIQGLTTITSLLGNILAIGDGLVAKTILLGVALKLLSLPKLIAWFKSLTIVQYATAVSSNTLTAAVAKTNSQGIMALVTTIPRLIVGLIALGREMGLAGIKALGFNGVLEKLNISPTMLTISAIAVALVGFSHVMGRIVGDYSAKVEDLQNSFDKLNEAKDNLKSVEDELSSTQTRISELERQGPLTIVEREELARLIKVNEELKKQKLLKSDLVDSNTSSVISSFVDAVESFQDDAEKPLSGWERAASVVMEAFGISGGAKKALSDFLGIDTDVSRDFTSAAESLEHLFKIYETTGRDDVYGGIAKYIEQLSAMQDLVADFDYSILSNDAKEALELIDKYEIKYIKLKGDSQDVLTYLLSTLRFKDLNDDIAEVIAGGEDLATVFGSLSGKLHTEKWTDFISALADAAEIDYGQAFMLTLQYLEGLQDDLADTGDNADALTQKFDTLKEAVDDLCSSYSTVSSAIKEFNENGAMSAETLEKLLALKPEYLNLLVDEEGQLNLTSEGYEKLIKAKLEEMVVSQMQAAFDYVLGLKVEEAAAYAAAEAYITETGTIYDLIAAKTQLALMDAASKDRAYSTDVYTKSIMRTVDVFAPLVNMVEQYTLASENATNATKQSTDALNKQKDALNDYKDSLEDAQSKIKSLIDEVSNYIKQQKSDEKDVLEERKKNFDDLIDKEKEELQTKKESAEFDKKLREKQNTVAKNALASSIAALDNSAAGKKTQKEANDNLISSRDDLYQTLSDHEYDIRIKTLDQLKEKNDEYYDGEIKKIEDYTNDARRIYEDACYLIEHDTGDLYAKLWAYTYKHTTKTKAEFDHMWSEAQTALEKYGVAQYGVIGLMELLQGQIYITDTKIEALESEIESLSGTVANTANSIVSSLGGANQAWQDLIDKVLKYKQLAAEQKAEQYSNTVTNKKYQREEERNAANWDSAHNKTTSDAKAWWYYDDPATGKQYKIYGYRDDAVDKMTTAIRDDQKSSLVKQGMNPAIADVMVDSTLMIKKMLLTGTNLYRHYANGTLSAYGGPSRVNEFGQEIRILNNGDGILTAKTTRNLSNFGANPVQFLADAGKKLLAQISGSGFLGGLFGVQPTAAVAVGSSGSMPITIVNHINGDVNPSTLKALEKAQKDITANAISGVFKTTLGLRNSSRVR